MPPRYPIIVITCLLLISCNPDEIESVKSFEAPGMDLQDELASEVRHDVFSTQYGSAEFYIDAIGTLGVFMGKSRSMQGHIDLQDGTMEFSVLVKSLNTGIEERDYDVFAVLKADQYPEIRFKGSFHPAFNPYFSEKQAVTATGEFHLHGVTNPVEVNGFLQQQGDAILMEAEWSMNVTDYDIDPPKVLFVSISNELDINVTARLLPISSD